MEENKISFVDLINDVEAGYEPTTTVHWHGKDIEIKRMLDLSDTLSFVSDVIDACYTTNSTEEVEFEDARIVYTPELKSYAIEYMTIVYYTNIDMVSSDADAYNFIRHSDIISIIVDNIDGVYYGEMLNAIDAKIKFINESNILEMTREFAAFNDAIEELGPAMSGIAQTFGSEEFQKTFETLSKIQKDNTLLDLAVKTSQSNDESIIQFAKSVNGDNDGRDS